MATRISNPTTTTTSVLFLLAFGILVMGVSAKACPQYCLDVDYMTCGEGNTTRLTPRCNCCLASKGCTLYLHDGNPIHCS